MKTLQEKYNAVLEGNFSKSQFVRSAKMEVSQFISPFNGFEDTVQILKNKGMLIEAKDETPEYDKPAPGYSIETIERGVDYELEKMGLMSNETVSEEDYAKAKKKAEKNLEKDVNYYLHILSGDSKNVDKHDREVEVDQKKLFKGTVDPKGGKAEGNTDTFNAMKKANLNEETKKQLAKLLKEGAVEDLAKKLGIDVDKLQASIDKIKKSEDIATAAAAKAAKPTYSEEKIDEGDPIVDEHEFDFFKEILDGRYKDEDIEEYLKSDVYQQALETLNLDASDTKEWIGEFTNFFGDGADAYIDEGNIKEAVKKVIKHVLAEGALDRFNDYEPEISNRTNVIQDILGELEQELETNIDIINGQIRKTGGAMSPAIQDATKKDIMDLVKMYVNKITYVKSEPVDIDGKKMYRISGAEPLNERVATLDNFISLIQDKAEDSGFEEGEEAIEVIEAIADHYGIKIQVGGFVGEEKEIVLKPINEALNKSLQDFGPDLQKRLQAVGLQAKVFPNAPEGGMIKRLQDNPKLAYIHFFKSGANEQIVIYAGKESQQKIQKVVDYFNLDSTNYGPDKVSGWVIKNAINKNPGDIMASKVAVLNGLGQVSIYRFDQGNYKNVKTTDKETGKADYLKAAE